MRGRNTLFVCGSGAHRLAKAAGLALVATGLLPGDVADHIESVRATANMHGAAEHGGAASRRSAASEMWKYMDALQAAFSDTGCKASLPHVTSK
eukprot:3925772-Alexandrium_andersonii.AAC.1